MATISIGPGATDRLSSLVVAGYTQIDMNKPATGSGTLTAIDLWFYVNAYGVKVGTFARSTVSNTYFTCRDSVMLAPVTAGSKATRTTDSGGAAIALAVCQGDCIGIHVTSGVIERSIGGSGIYYLAGDNCGSGDIGAYTLIAGAIPSIFASGATPAAGGGAWTQFSKANGQAFDLIYSMPGIKKDDTAKVIGIAV
jgi:hypothetical protein